MSKSDILTMIDRATKPDVMTKAEALEFLEVLGEDITLRMACIKEDMRSKDDLAKLPKLKTSRGRPQAGTAPTQVTTRFKIPKAKK